MGPCLQGHGMLTGLARSCMMLAAWIMVLKDEHACLPASCRLLCDEGCSGCFCWPSLASKIAVPRYNFPLMM